MQKHTAFFYEIKDLIKNVKLTIKKKITFHVKDI